MSRNKKQIPILLLLIWMIVIFALSSQPAGQSNSLSEKVTEIIIWIVGYIYPLDIETSTIPHYIYHINGLVRECAHSLEYVILSILALNALVKSGTRLGRVFVLSFMFCVLYAVTDEVHQIFVPGRACELKDFILDCTGTLIGSGIYCIFGWLKGLQLSEKHKVA